MGNLANIPVMSNQWCNVLASADRLPAIGLVLQ
jgi:hypothetical protein